MIEVGFIKGGSVVDASKCKIRLKIFFIFVVYAFGFVCVCSVRGTRDVYVCVCAVWYGLV